MKLWHRIFCPNLLKKIGKLRSKVGIDFLTGLKNRLEYEREINFLFKKNKKDKNTFFVFLDIDNFKLINDKLGHNVGDDFLKEISKVFLDNLRSTDEIFRIGGDEFVFLISRIEKEKLKEKLSVINHLIENKSPKEVEISLSIGVYKINFKEDTPESVLEKADRAMYEAKKNGKNQIVFYEEIKKK